jgi:putative hydroxymethylpyrimidine transport system permease protein
MTSLARTFATLAAVLVGWQALVWITGLQHFILPGPIKVAEALYVYRGLIAEHAVVTLGEVVAGVALGVTLGVATGLHLMSSPGARQFVHPLMVSSQAIPVFALAPILTLWMGYGMAPKITMAVLITYFPVASNFYDGLRRTDPALLDLAQTMGASPRQVLFKLRLPSALPSLGSGLRLAAVYAPIGAVIGEWVGASQGLGYLMLYANARTKVDLMFAAVLVLAAMTLVLHWAAGRASHRLSRAAGAQEDA